MDVAKDIIVELIRQAGGMFEGTTRLYKAFYFAHLFYFESSGRMLSDWPIVRMPGGPGIDRGASILRALQDDGVLVKSARPKGPYNETVYRLLSEVETDLDLAGRIAIKDACTFVENKTAETLSSLTHEWSRSWNHADSGEELNIYLDLLSDEDYELQLSQLQESQEAIKAALGSS